MDITLGTYATVLGLTTWRVVKVTGIGKLIAGSKNVTDLVPFGVGNVVGVTGGLCTGGILGGLGWLSYQASVYGGQLTLWGATGADSTTQYHGVEPIRSPTAAPCCCSSSPSEAPPPGRASTRARSAS